MDTKNEELLNYYQPAEEELTLYHISVMISSIAEQLYWIKKIIDQEIERVESATPENKI